MTTRKSRPRPGQRHLAALASAAMMLTLYPLAGVAGAQGFDLGATCPVAAPAAPFDDREQTPTAHASSVDCAYALGITEGSPQNGQLLFMPSEGVRRDWMASFIVRALDAAGYDLPAPSDQRFTDITGNTHKDNIQILAEIGVTKGVTKTEYRPDDIVGRDQMASFLVRATTWAFEGKDGPGFEAQDPPYFTDVPSRNVHYDNINAAYSVLGLTKGVTENQYHPSGRTERDQMATFLIRMISLIWMR